MTIKIPFVSAERIKHLQQYSFTFIKLLSITQRGETDVYDVEIEYPEYLPEAIAHEFFGAGVSFGLDLKYSSYGTEPERMR